MMLTTIFLCLWAKAPFWQEIHGKWTWDKWNREFPYLNWTITRTNPYQRAGR